MARVTHLMRQIRRLINYRWSLHHTAAAAAAAAAAAVVSMGGGTGGGGGAVPANFSAFNIMPMYAYVRCMERIDFKWSSSPPPNRRAVAPPLVVSWSPSLQPRFLWTLGAWERPKSCGELVRLSAR